MPLPEEVLPGGMLTEEFDEQDLQEQFDDFADDELLAVTLQAESEAEISDDELMRIAMTMEQPQ